MVEVTESVNKVKKKMDKYTYNYNVEGRHTEWMKKKNTHTHAWIKDPSIRFEWSLFCLGVVVFLYYQHDKSHRVNWILWSDKRENITFSTNPKITERWQQNKKKWRAFLWGDKQIHPS